MQQKTGLKKHVILWPELICILCTNMQIRETNDIIYLRREALRREALRSDARREALRSDTRREALRSDARREA